MTNRSIVIAEDTDLVAEQIVETVRDLTKRGKGVHTTLSSIGRARNYFAQLLRRGPGRMMLEDIIRIGRQSGVGVNTVVQRALSTSPALELAGEGMALGKRYKLPQVRRAVARWKATRSVGFVPDAHQAAEEIRATTVEDPAEGRALASAALGRAKDGNLILFLIEFGEASRRLHAFRNASAALGWAGEMAWRSEDWLLFAKAALSGRLLRSDQGRLDDALALCDEAAGIFAREGLYDRVGGAILNRANAYYYADAFREASVDALRGAGLVSPGILRASSLQTAAACQARLNQGERALNLVKRARKEEGIPCALEGHLGWVEGVAYGICGQGDEATKAMESAIAKLPPGADALLAIGEFVEILTKFGRPLEASIVGRSLSSLKTPLREDPLDEHGVLRSCCRMLMRAIARADQSVAIQAALEMKAEGAARRVRLARRACAP